ncbi:MAG: B12-binding domain-containing radical SAM protein [Nitrospira sp.]|nr:B12-binding domain-containing radical SAM protein [bacterium]MBL7049344.1 B12-binding domain-containing radical SAM protein [Nitrospira sp.]
MKLLLISLQSNAYITGLKYVAASAMANGHEVKILYLPGYLEKDLDRVIEDFLRKYRPDLIGISLMSIEYYPAKNLTRLLKARFRARVIWGGVHAVIRPEECIQYADYVCTGEGERVIVSLLDYLQHADKSELPEIPGLWVNTGTEIIRNPLAEPNPDLDSLPVQQYLPDYFYVLHNGKILDFSDNEKLFRMYALYGGTCHMIISTRGCPFKCAYCGNSAFIHVYGRKVRERSVDSVLDEIREVIKNSFVLYMNFQDDCFFTHSIEWVREFSERYKKEVNLPFIVRVIPTMIDQEKITLLKKAGMCWVVMGVQSGCDRVNYEIYDRRIKFESVKNASDIIAATGAAAFYEMIVDNPYETEEDRMETIHAISTLKKPFVTSLAHLTFFPGTALADRAVAEGVTEPDAYLYRYLLNIDDTYQNRLLSITSIIPSWLVRLLNKPEKERSGVHELFLNIFYFLAKRLVEPGVFFFTTARSLNYRIDWLYRTVAGNGKATLSRLISRYLAKGDLDYDSKLKAARKEMPELFEK